LKEKRSINKDKSNESMVAKKEPLNIEKDNEIYVKVETDA